MRPESAFEDPDPDGTILQHFDNPPARDCLGEWDGRQFHAWGLGHAGLDEGQRSPGPHF